jgi:hypothetical protein
MEETHSMKLLRSRLITSAGKQITKAFSYRELYKLLTHEAAGTNSELRSPVPEEETRHLVTEIAKITWNNRTSRLRDTRHIKDPREARKERARLATERLAAKDPKLAELLLGKKA